MPSNPPSAPMPAGDPMPATLGREIDELRKIVGVLYQNATTQVSEPAKDHEIIFSYFDTPYPADRSAPYPFYFGSGVIRNIAVGIKAAGLSTSTVSLLINDISKQTLTISAGQKFTSFGGLNIPVTNGDLVSVLFGTVGINISGITLVISVASE